MKRLIIILATAMVAVGAMAAVAPVVKVMGDLHPYKYAYIIPTGSVASSPGGAAIVGNVVIGEGTKTVNPSEVIAGHLMKMGYTILPSIVPELAEETMIFSFGRAGTRPLGLLEYASKIIIQISSGKTHDLLATIEAEGCGETESDDINRALYDAMNVFVYSINPELKFNIQKFTHAYITFDISNHTPDVIMHIALYVSYYKNDSLVHTQKAHISLPKTLYPGHSILKTIPRDKVAQDKNMQIKVDLIGYE